MLCPIGGQSVYSGELTQWVLDQWFLCGQTSHRKAVHLMDAKAREAFLASAVEKVRARIADVSPDLTVDVTLSIEEALVLLSVRPSRPSVYASTLTRLRLDAQESAQRLAARRVPTYHHPVSTADTQLSAYGLPPVHTGQGE